MTPDLHGIKVARVSTVPYFLVAQLSAQIQDLISAGADVLVVTSAGPELDQLAQKKVAIRVIEIPRSLSPFKDLVALIRLVWCLRRHRPDIVHSTTPKAGLLCALAGVLARVPVRLHTFTGQPWVELRGFMRWATRKADWLIGACVTQAYADSKHQAAFLVAEKIIAASKISVLGHGSLAGVDLKRFDPSRWSAQDKAALRKTLGIAPHAPIILFVGRLTRDKGIHELLEAFTQLQKSGVDADLLLVGPIDNERGEGAGITDVIQGSRIHHVHYTPCPEQYMAIADFLCLPSYREGFGTVVIEAAAMGLPTVGTRIYGLADAIEDGVTGVLVPPRDAAELARAMQRLLSEPALREKMAADARARCVELFDSNKVNQAVAEEYQRLVRMRRV